MLLAGSLLNDISHTWHDLPRIVKANILAVAVFERDKVKLRFRF